MFLSQHVMMQCDVVLGIMFVLCLCCIKRCFLMATLSMDKLKSVLCMWFVFDVYCVIHDFLLAPDCSEVYHIYFHHFLQVHTAKMCVQVCSCFDLHMHACLSVHHEVLR